MKVQITAWKGVSSWKWDIPGDDTCSICHDKFESTCATCSIPGDNCPLAISECSHRFHAHCIYGWLSASDGNNCPTCRQTWVSISKQFAPRDPKGNQVRPPRPVEYRTAELATDPPA